MRYRRLGRSDLDVSVVCLGTMTFGSPVEEPDAVRLVHEALDRGINFFDTANIYEGYTRVIGNPGGRAEEILGQALLGRRDRAVLVTKVANPVGPGEGDKGLSPAHVRREIDKSLRRLRTDHVDVYYLHKPDPATPLADSLAAFNELIVAGKARHYGFSNFDATQVEEMLRICDVNRLLRPLVTQPPYSLIKRGIESDLLPLCRREGIAVTPYQVLQSGLLTGKYRRGMPAPAGSRKFDRADWMCEFTGELYDALERLEAEARAAGIPMAEYAIAWALNQPDIVSAIVGVHTADHLREAIRAAERAAA